jgi:hypothetical protein
MKDSMRRAVVLSLIPCALMMFQATAAPQDPPAQPAAAAEQQPLNPQQLESMVAPIALYPDTLLSQVLVASTYPLEVVEAQQFLDQNKALTGAALVDAAKNQNWDPSIQALVAFPDVLKRLNSDIRWTTDLGNAFLAQQADVMAAVQRLRASAKDAGKLTDTPQQKIVTENQNGQAAIEIQPTDPQVVYVPTYNPAYFWGLPPPLYPWPPLFYPGIGIGWGWGLGINLGFYFPGCCGWGGWGWGFGWFGGGIFVNGPFFHRYGFNGFHGSFGGRGAWAHDPVHRGGVPYPRSVAGRFGGAERSVARPNAAAVRSNKERSNERSSGARANESHPNNHSAFGGSESGSRARQQSDHGFSSMGSARTAPAFHGGGGGGGFRGGGGGGRR